MKKYKILLNIDPYQNEPVDMQNRSILSDYPYLCAVKDRLAQLMPLSKTWLMYEEPQDMDTLLNRGALMPTDMILSIPGEPGRCHDNALRLWQGNPVQYSLATGYALSPENIWRRHSWCVTPEQALVETTDIWTQYFGYVLTLEETLDFCY